MKKTKKIEKAKFFCESCGSEVAQNARVCTYCGKFFSSVRCPNCGLTGKTEAFIHGCPECGYAVTPTKSNIRNNSSYSNNKSSSLFRKIFSSNKNSNSTGDTGLPFWVYIICLLILISLVICLYSCL